MVGHVGGRERRDVAVGAEVAHLAAAEARERHLPEHAPLAAVLAPLVAVEEEGAVLDDGAADGAAVGVADERGPLDARAVVEEVVGREDRRAVEPEAGAVERVGAALGDDGDLRARGAAHLRVGVRRDDAELVHGLGVEPEHGVVVGRVAALLRVAGRVFEAGRADLVGLRLVDVHAVERDVGLVGARARDVAGARHAGLEREERGDVARFERQLRDLLRDEVVAERGVLPVDERLVGLRRDGDGVGEGADFELRVDLRGLRDQRAHVRQHDLLEARGLDLDAVGAGLNQLEGVDAAVARRLRARRVGLRVDERHGGPGHDVALRVCHRAAHGGRAGLRRRGDDREQRHEQAAGEG